VVQLVHPSTPLVLFGSYYLFNSSWPPSVGSFWFQSLHLLSAMVTFEEMDPTPALDHDPSMEQEIIFDQEFTSSGAVTYLTDHVLTPARFALRAFFDLHGIDDIDDFM
jgi:hypothetical protein